MEDAHVVVVDEKRRAVERAGSLIVVIDVL